MKTPIRRIHRKYVEGGLRRVLSGIWDHVALTVTKPFTAAMARRLQRSMDVLDRDALLSSTGRCWRFGEEQRFSITYPVDFRPPGGDSGQQETYALDRPFVCEVMNSGVVGAGGLVVSPAGLLGESAESSDAVLQNRLESLIRELGPLKAHKAVTQTETAQPDFDTVFPMRRHPSVNYYHWILGYLGRVRALEVYRSETGIDPVVLVNPDEPNWVVESMQLAGFDCNSLEAVDSPILSANRVVVPVHRTRYFDQFEPSPAELEFLAERIRTNRDSLNRDYCSRIYISRDDADTRRVRNEHELEQMLDEFGFETYLLSEMPFAEQVALFEQAEIIVGPHGAGFVNMLFADDPTIIEILPEQNPSPVYVTLARQLGFEYSYILGPRDGADLFVDCDEVRNVIQDALDS